jgi:hypothetical protein
LTSASRKTAAREQRLIPSSHPVGGRSRGIVVISMSYGRAGLWRRAAGTIGGRDHNRAGRLGRQGPNGNPRTGRSPNGGRAMPPGGWASGGRAAAASSPGNFTPNHSGNGPPYGPASRRTGPLDHFAKPAGENGTPHVLRPRKGRPSISGKASPAAALFSGVVRNCDAVYGVISPHARATLSLPGFRRAGYASVGGLPTDLSAL